MLALQKQEFSKAKTYLDGSENIRLSVLGTEHPDYAASLSNRLMYYYVTDDKKNWSQASAKTLRTWQNSTTHLLLSFGEKEKQNYLDNHLSQRDLFLSMLYNFYQKGNTDLLQSCYFSFITALQGWLLSGSQQLNTLVGRHKDSSLTKLYEQWSSAKSQYARAITLTENQQKKQNLDPDSMQQASLALEKQIIDALPELRQTLENTSVSSSQVSRKLSNKEALVNWVSFLYRNREQWTDSVYYAAFIILPGDTTAHFVAGFEEKKLKFLLRRYFNYSGRGAAPVATTTVNRSVGNELYKLVWQPLLPYLSCKENIYIIPSGLLNKISFSSLADSAGNTLLETTKLHVLNNADDLKTAKAHTLAAGSSISLFGGAVFDSLPSGKRIQRNSASNWTYLPGTANEVSELSRLFTNHQYDIHTYTGLSASEENIKKLSGRQTPAILHIATHGFYLPPSTQAVDKTDIGKEEGAQDFPLLRNGFLLSGANVFWKRDTALTEGEDGIVTAQEIANLDFSKTDLVTLSACETALGDVNNNEGVYGLQRAFKIAGAKELLITLWQIPDKETQELMSLFYQQLLTGDTYYNALRSAQLSMKKKYPDHSIWAGFELIGE